MKFCVFWQFEYFYCVMSSNSIISKHVLYALKMCLCGGSSLCPILFHILYHFMVNIFRLAAHLYFFYKKNEWIFRASIVVHMPKVPCHLCGVGGLISVTHRGCEKWCMRNSQQNCGNLWCWMRWIMLEWMCSDSLLCCPHRIKLLIIMTSHFQNDYSSVWEQPSYSWYIEW